MSRLGKITSLCGVLVLAVSAGVWFFIFRKNQEHSYVPVKKGTIVESIYGIGTVNSSRIYQLKVGMASVIVELFVKEGDQVEKGSKLLVLDGQQEFFAPFDGAITKLPFHEGEAIFPQMVLLTMADFTNLYVQVALEQQGALKVKTDQLVTLSFDGMRDVTFEGRVSSVYTSDDKYLVRIEPQKLLSSILPGMTADVAITIAPKENVLLIPVSGINIDQVRIKKDGTHHDVRIETGVLDGNIAEVIRGDLQEGDLILIAKE